MMLVCPMRVWVSLLTAPAALGLLSSAVSAQDPVGRASYAQLGEEYLRLSDRLAALERMVAQLVDHQDLDQLANRQIASEFARFKADTEARLNLMEMQRTATIEEGATSPFATDLANLAEPIAPEVDRFAQGLTFAAQGDWPQAELAFDTFIRNNPNDQRIAEARYRLGLSYLGQQQPAQAARIFLDLFQTGAAIGFGPENLFSLADALRQLDPGNSAQVCAVYSEIEITYSETLSANQREELLNRNLAGNCADNQRSGSR